MKTTLLLLLALLAVATPASADARKPRTVLEKLEAVRLPAPAVYRIDYGWPAGVPRETGSGTDVHAATIYTGGNMLPGEVRAHEMCHLLVFQSFSDADKRRFARLVGLPEMADEWIAGESGTGWHGFDSPEEWLCDYYAMLAVGADPRREMFASYAPHPTRRRLLRVGRSLDRLRVRTRLKTYRYRDPLADDVPRRKRHRDGTITGSNID